MQNTRYSLVANPVLWHSGSISLWIHFAMPYLDYPPFLTRCTTVVFFTRSNRISVPQWLDWSFRNKTQQNRFVHCLVPKFCPSTVQLFTFRPLLHDHSMICFVNYDDDAKLCHSASNAHEFLSFSDDLCSKVVSKVWPKSYCLNIFITFALAILCRPSWHSVIRSVPVHTVESVNHSNVAASISQRLWFNIH